ADPTNLFRSLFSSAGFLYTGADEEHTLDGLIDDSMHSLDQDPAKAAFDAIQEQVESGARSIPLYHPVYTLAAGERVHGLSFEPQLDSPASSYDVWVAR